jgi:hypothetical protein
MTLYQFKVLKQQEQYQTVWDSGVYLTDRIVENNRFALYQIDSFYVEIFYNTNENKIISIKSFLSTDLLEPYLDKIKIEL